MPLNSQISKISINLKVLSRGKNRPFVAVFRDFMADSERLEFLELAKGRLHRSMGRMKNFHEEYLNHSIGSCS